MGLWVRLGTRHSLRPPISEGRLDTKLGRETRRGNAEFCPNRLSIMAATFFILRCTKKVAD
jgi:hypothetical protein